MALFHFTPSPSPSPSPVITCSGSSFDNFGAVALSEAFKSNLTLITLNMGRNSIRDNEAQALSEACGINLTVTIKGI
ncbi:hypothetical protein BGZ90_004660, partial [Linnemannia elongata]